MMQPDKQMYVDQKAFIEKDGKILMLKDPLLGLDFPGGKIQEGETDFIQSLQREIREETTLEVSVGKPFTTWHYLFPENGHRNAGMEVYLVGFKCTYGSGEVVLSSEHDDFRWVDESSYEELKAWGGYYEVLQQYFLNS